MPILVTIETIINTSSSAREAIYALVPTISLEAKVGFGKIQSQINSQKHKIKVIGLWS